MLEAKNLQAEVAAEETFTTARQVVSWACEETRNAVLTAENGGTNMNFTLYRRRGDFIIYRIEHEIYIVANRNRFLRGDRSREASWVRKNRANGKDKIGVTYPRNRVSRDQSWRIIDLSYRQETRTQVGDRGQGQCDRHHATPKLGYTTIGPKQRAW